LEDEFPLGTDIEQDLSEWIMSVGGLVLVVEAQQHPNPHSYKIVKLTLTCPHQELEDEFPFGIPGMPFFQGANWRTVYF